MNFLDTIFYNNSMKLWILGFVVVLVGTLAQRILKAIVVKRLRVLTEKTDLEWDNLVVVLIESTKTFLFLLLSLYVATLVLNLPQQVDNLVKLLLGFAVLVQSAIWGQGVIDFLIGRYKRQKLEKDAASVTTMAALGFLAKLGLWVFIVLLALDNLGVNITGLVAGLGVGGIAIALAVQNVLGDLFASMSIVLDKPFVIGDFVIVDNFLGTIQKVGLKTTRIQSLSGEQIVFSNNDLLSSRIRNYKRMFERRVVFSIGVIYQTPYDQVVAIPAMLREIIEKQEMTRFDRAHFKEYGPYALNYEIVYYVKNPDYNVYMDIQQAVNLEIYQRFEREGIEFAYPTQTLFMQNQSANQEAMQDAIDR